jgi:hypothetical protein
VLYSPPISSNTKVRIQIRSRSEFQNFSASFRTPRYNNFLTSIPVTQVHTYTRQTQDRFYLHSNCAFTCVLYVSGFS